MWRLPQAAQSAQAAHLTLGNGNNEFSCLETKNKSRSSKQDLNKQKREERLTLLNIQEQSVSLF